MNLKDKLNNLTGLQRVFLVAFLVCWGYFGAWRALEQAADARTGNMDFAWSIHKDFDNPACAPYTSKPLEGLPRPQWTSQGGTCWHIYAHRALNDVKLPLTEEAYGRGQAIHYWKIFFIQLGIYSALVFVAFGLIFLAYKIGLWIFAGFKKAK